MKRLRLVIPATVAVDPSPLGPRISSSSPTSSPCFSAYFSSITAPSSAEAGDRLVRALGPVELGDLPSVAGSIPVSSTSSAPGSISVGSSAVGETTPTPSTAATSSAIRAGIGEKPSVLTIATSPTNWRSSVRPSEARIEEAKTPTKVTSATPIISAAAVDAVRAGLALRVLARELAGDPAQALDRPAERARERGDEAVADHRQRR